MSGAPTSLPDIDSLTEAVDDLKKRQAIAEFKKKERGCIERQTGMQLLLLT